MTYYRVLADNSRYADRWFLDDPLAADGRELDAREFRYGQTYTGPSPVVLPIGRDGRRVAFHLAAFDMPVVSTEIANILDRIGPGDIQRFPVKVDNTICGYEIVNAVTQQNCVDEGRSGARKWGLEDGRSDKIGQYREFAQLVIDPSRTNARHIFRIWGSLVELIVSDEVKRAIERLPELGVIFKSVSGPEAGKRA